MLLCGIDQILKAPSLVEFAKAVLESFQLRKLLLGGLDRLTILLI
jgi:hypothetical protein